MDHLALHLDVTNVARRIEDLVRHHHWCRDAFVVAPVRLGRCDAQRRCHHASGGVTHVVAQRHRLELDPGIENRGQLAEVPVAEQRCPRLLELRPVILRRDLTNILDHAGSFYDSRSQATALVSRYCSKPSTPFWRPMPLAL